MSKKGFTLIELLVVIAVLAVLAAGVFIAIDPLDKIKAANDSKVQNDIGQIAQGLEAYAVANQGSYPSALTYLTISGDLKIVPVPPNASGYGVAYSYYAGFPTTGGVCGTVQSKKYTMAAAATAWAWCSSIGKAGTVASCGVCPL